jgi:hypothetical protein
VRVGVQVAGIAEHDTEVYEHSVLIARDVLQVHRGVPLAGNAPADALQRLRLLGFVDEQPELDGHVHGLGPMQPHQVVDEWRRRRHVGAVAIAGVGSTPWAIGFLDALRAVGPAGWVEGVHVHGVLGPAGVCHLDGRQTGQHRPQEGNACAEAGF